MLRVGRITGAHGLKGTLRYRPDNPDSDTIEQVERVMLEIGGIVREYQVATVTRLNPATQRVTLAGVADANAAEALKGAIVMVANEDLPPARPGEFYYYEAIGCAVYLTDGSSIGNIEEVFSNGAHDVWVVRDGQREVLVPVIEDVVKAMDFAARRVTIEPVPGLLD
jgi:16S rRNA processing protein RimM